MQFPRSSGSRFYKRLFLVGVEGTRTERDYFSLSNPKFEFWLLLHFEDGTFHTTAKACYEALCSHLPDYSKSLKRSDFDRAKIDLACARAKALLGTADPTDWPRLPGQTTVFTLCEAIRRVDEEEQQKLMDGYVNECGNPEVEAKQ